MQSHNTQFGYIIKPIINLAITVKYQTAVFRIDFNPNE